MHSTADHSSLCKLILTVQHVLDQGQCYIVRRIKHIPHDPMTVCTETAKVYTKSVHYMRKRMSNKINQDQHSLTTPT